MKILNDLRLCVVAGVGVCVSVGFVRSLESHSFK